MPCSKRMRDCKIGCLHRDFVESYNQTYQSWKEDMDAVCFGYEDEEKEFRKTNPPPLLKDWMKMQ